MELRLTSGADEWDTAWFYMLHESRMAGHTTFLETPPNQRRYSPQELATDHALQRHMSALHELSEANLSQHGDFEQTEVAAYATAAYIAYCELSFNLIEGGIRVP